MKNILRSLGQGFVIAIGFLLTIGLVGISYAAWVNISNVKSGEGLTADLMNNIIDNQNDLNSRIEGLNLKQLPSAWVQFYGANGTILDSYNVSSVSYSGVGQYVINFETDMNSASYVSFADGCSGFDAWTDNEGVGSLMAKVRETNSGWHNCGVVSVLVFGGK